MRRGSQESAPDSRTGLEIRGLRGEEKERLGVEHGVLVTAVTGGPARQAGIRQGDVITSFNNEPIDSVADFDELVDNTPANVSIPVRIVRRGTPDYTVLKSPNESPGRGRRSLCGRGFGCPADSDHGGNWLDFIAFLRAVQACTDVGPPGPGNHGVVYPFG
ncbi:MAG: PDZ domain-containing protein [Gammaproteobacteria bacterium]|nr:PDZ domain-containing protein [Gammaproteobacteria bacterium]